MHLPLPLKIWIYHVVYALRAAIASIIRQLPGSWSVIGVPGRPIPSLKRWVHETREQMPDRWERTQGPTYEMLGPPVTMKRPAPRTFGDAEVPHELTIDRYTAHAELFLAVLPGARVLGPEGAVVTAGGRLVAESTWPHRHLPHGRAWNSLILPKSTDLRGAIYTVASPGASGYYHWVIEVLPRLFALETLPFDDSRIILNGPLSPWQEESLHLLGIDRSRWLLLGQQYLRAELLLLPSFLGDPSPHPVACSWLRQKLLSTSKPSRQDRRIYVTRRTARRRRVVNESELEPVLRENGFEVVEAEQLSVTDQIRLFSEAGVIIGPHGAGLTNILFAPEGCKILEFFQPSYILASTYKIATCLGQEYWYLTGRCAPNDGRDSPNTRDIVIDRDRFAVCLKYMQDSELLPVCRSDPRTGFCQE